MKSLIIELGRPILIFSKNEIFKEITQDSMADIQIWKK